MKASEGNRKGEGTYTSEVKKHTLGIRGRNGNWNTSKLATKQKARQIGTLDEKKRRAQKKKKESSRIKYRHEGLNWKDKKMKTEAKRQRLKQKARVAIEMAVWQKNTCKIKKTKTKSEARNWNGRIANNKYARSKRRLDTHGDAQKWKDRNKSV
jgi:hypothetical protein